MAMAAWSAKVSNQSNLRIGKWSHAIQVVNDHDAKQFVAFEYWYRNNRPDFFDVFCTIRILRIGQDVVEYGSCGVPARRDLQCWSGRGELDFAP